MSHVELWADALALLRDWQPPDQAQASLAQAYLGFLLARPDATARSCVPGHLTASAVVLSADRASTLLTLHPRVARWLQLGGHCEDDDNSIAGAALREATEESGIEGLRIQPQPIRLDVHPISCSLGIPTRHFDVRFAVIAPPGALPVISGESEDLAWWPVDGLPQPIGVGVADTVAAAIGTGFAAESC
ncbi:MAG: NUDIX hydrolase [Actinomycetota bacterium]|nr:NUDIX hydrolase [Actinomycetota bacterium]